MPNYIPNGDYRSLNMIGAGGTYPPKWWKPLRITLAWIGFATVIWLLWSGIGLAWSLVR